MLPGMQKPGSPNYIHNYNHSRQMHCKLLSDPLTVDSEKTNQLLNSCLALHVIRML